MEQTKISSEEIKNKYIFVKFGIDVDKKDTYWCNCGHSFENDNYSSSSELTGFEITVSFEEYMNSDFFNTSNLSKRAFVSCPNCKKDFSRKEVYAFIYNVGEKFLEKFKLFYDDNSLTLEKRRYSASVINEDQLEIKEETSGIRIYNDENQETKISYLRYNGQIVEGNLKNVLHITNDFFDKIEQVEIIEDFVYVYDYIGKMGKFVSDADNINIVNNLLSDVKLNSGIEVIKKIISTFLAIICYPNLSTLALVKDTVFLYDLINGCPLPSTEYMKESNATSPLKIFNYLINLKNVELQSKLDTDDVNKLGYKFINKEGKETNIKFDNYTERFENINKVSKEKTKIFVRDEIVNRSISPFVFNKLNKFEDYENLIKFLRFINYNQLIDICTKYDKDFLIEFYKLIEFRDDITYDRIIQMISIVSDFCKSINAHKEEKIRVEDVSKYNFDIYDHCQLILIELQWDFNKVFYKIKSHDKLISFHNDLIKHRSYLNDSSVNEKYIEFSDKFKYLENYNGPIKIKLLSTPNDLVSKAKEMQNCAASFVKRVAAQEYIAFNVYDNNSEKQQKEFHEYMMVLEKTKYGLEFVGVKGPCNIYGPDRFKKDVMQFLEDNDIAYKEVPSIKLGLLNEK